MTALGTDLDSLISSLKDDSPKKTGSDLDSLITSLKESDEDKKPVAPTGPLEFPDTALGGGEGALSITSQPVPPPTPPQPPVPVKDQVLNAMKALVKGVSGLGTAGLRGKAALDKAFTNAIGMFEDEPIEEGAFFKAADAIDKFVEENFEGDPRLADSFFAETLPGAAGSLIGFVGLGAGLRALNVGGTAALALMGGTVGAGSDLDRALAAGASDEEALLASGWGFLFGLTEAVPVARMFDRFDKSSGGVFKRRLTKALKEAGKGGFEEALQETFQGVGSNAMMKAMFDRDQELLEDVAKQGAAGGILGTAASLIAQGLGIRKRRRRTARRLLEGDPDLAQRIVDEGEPSRRGAISEVTDLEVEKDTAEQRTEFAQDLKQEIDDGVTRAQQEGTEAVAEEGVDDTQEDQVTAEEEITPEAALEEIGEGPPTILPAVPRRPSRGLTRRVEETRSRSAAAKAREELGTAVDELGKFLEGRTFSTPIDPELVRRVSTVVVKAAKAGVLTTKEIIERVASKVSAEVMEKLRPIIEQEFEKVKGRPELANPAVTPGDRDVVNIVDEVRESQGVPEVVRDVDVAAEAAARLAKDREGEVKRLIEIGQSGGTLGGVDTVVAKEIIKTEGLSSIKSDDVEGILRGVILVDSYRRTGTEEARGFRQRRDADKNPDERRARFLTEAILTPPQAQQTKIEDAKKKGNEAEVEKLRREWAKEVKKLKAELKAQGLDNNAMEEAAKDPVAYQKALRTLAATKADIWDAAYEYWSAGILFGMGTQAVNVIGTATNAAYSLTVKRMVSAVVNVGVRSPEAAQLGEFPHLVYGFWPGIKQGLKNAWMSFKTEAPWLEVSLGREGTRMLEEKNVAIKGLKGRVLRGSFRTLLAADEFNKTVIARMEVNAHAYRIAKSEGLSGKALGTRILDLTTDVDSKAWDRAIESAIDLSFQERTSKLLKWILSGRGKFYPSKFILPFATTPFNLARQGIRQTPVGLAKMPSRLMKASRTGDWSQVPERAAEQVIALAALALIWDWTDPDDLKITGAAPEANFETREEARRTIPALHIKIAGTWYPYGRVEPFATAVGLMADWIAAARSGDRSRMALVPLTSTLGQLKSKTFLAQLSDVVSFIDRTDPSDKIFKWVTNFAVSWIPFSGLSRSTLRETKDTFPERGVWGEGLDRNTRILRRMIQKTELGFIEDEPKVDLWGREQRRPNALWSPMAQTDFLFKAMIPIRPKDIDIAPGDLVILNWNRQNPRKDRHPKRPGKTYSVKREKQFMTDGQYTQFLRLAGKTSDLLVRKFELKEDEPEQADIDIVGGMLSRARAAAKKELVKEWLGGKKAPTPEELTEEVFRKFRILRVKQRRRGATKIKRTRLGNIAETGEDFRERAEAAQELRKRAAAELSRVP